MDKKVIKEYKHKNGYSGFENGFNFFVKVIDGRSEFVDIEYNNSLSLDTLELLAGDLLNFVKKIKKDQG